jgi:hypothetical protein
MYIMVIHLQSDKNNEISIKIHLKLTEILSFNRLITRMVFYDLFIVWAQITKEREDTGMNCRETAMREGERQIGIEDRKEDKGLREIKRREKERSTGETAGKEWTLREKKRRHRGRGRIDREEGKQREVEVQRGRDEKCGETEEKMREREEKQQGE